MRAPFVLLLASALFAGCGPQVLNGSSCSEEGVGAEECELTALHVCDGRRWQKTSECHYRCVEGPPTAHTLATLVVSETWTCAAGPHLVEQVTTLAPGVTLSVEAGAEVRFRPGTRIDTTPQSRVVAEGTAYAPILFTADDRVVGGWGSANQGGLNLFLREPGAPRSVLRHALVERAVNGVGLLGVDDAKELPVLEDSHLRDNLSWGVVLRGCVGTPTPVTLEDAGNLFVGNGEGAISPCQ
jgi:hypothetical protein